jgi:protein phosphatase
MQQTNLLFESGAATDVGRVRSRNEDSYLVHPKAGIWAVADGMGGHEGGDLASQTVVASLRTVEPPNSAADLLADCQDRVATANGKLREIGRQRDTIIGSTLVAFLAYDGHYACVWSGDSRLYVVRRGEITQLSQDHTEVQELVAGGVITAEQAKSWPGRNVITRAIGVYDEAELEISSGPLEAGDSFILCSDGLTNHVEDREILECVSANVSQAACDRLIELALERGGTDNVTVVVARYRPDRETTVRPDALAAPQGR